MFVYSDFLATSSVAEHWSTGWIKWVSSHQMCFCPSYRCCLSFPYAVRSSCWLPLGGGGVHLSCKLHIPSLSHSSLLTLLTSNTHTVCLSVSSISVALSFPPRTTSDLPGSEQLILGSLNLFSSSVTTHSCCAVICFQHRATGFSLGFIITYHQHNFWDLLIGQVGNSNRKWR